MTEATPTPARLDLGTAGASALREYEARAERERKRKQDRIDHDREWRDRIKAEKPVLVGAALALTRAVTLHDRRIPRSEANIDHIAVGPAGVYVIGAESYTGRVRKRDVGGLFRVDARLYVAGRDRSILLDGMRRQLDVVRTALGDMVETTPVSGVLCFVDAEWSLFAKPLRFDGVTCVRPEFLAPLVESPGPLGEERMQAIAARLAVALPPA